MQKDPEPQLLGFQRAVLEGVYNSILEEIIDDAILDLCFEVHRAVKLGYYFPDDAEMQKPKCDDGKHDSRCFIDADREDVDIFGEVPSKMKFSVSCPRCQQKLEATRYATHLDKCMGMGRQSSRVASQKFANMDTVDSDYDDDFENGTDFSYNTNKKRTKKKQGKNSARRLPKKQGPMMGQSDGSSTPQDMSYEEKTSFLNQMCGVISRHTGRMCTKTLKCSQHTDEQKRDVRLTLLDRGCIADQLADDVQIDVDTVDEDNNSHRFWDQTNSRSPSPIEYIPTSTVKKEEKKPFIISRSTAAYFHKKKSLGTSNTVIEFNQSASASSSFDAM